MKALLESIRKVQELNNLSDRQLALRLKVDPGTISLLKRRKTKPQVKVLKALVREFPEIKLDVYEYLSEGEDEHD